MCPVRTICAWMIEERVQSCQGFYMDRLLLRELGQEEYRVTTVAVSRLTLWLANARRRPLDGAMSEVRRTQPNKERAPRQAGRDGCELFMTHRPPRRLVTPEGNIRTVEVG